MVRVVVWMETEKRSIVACLGVADTRRKQQRVIPSSREFKKTLAAAAAARDV
jgi:hypothetical protein